VVSSQKWFLDVVISRKDAKAQRCFSQKWFLARAISRKDAKAQRCFSQKWFLAKAQNLTGTAAKA
jgi:hypothetical protein